MIPIRRRRRRRRQVRRRTMGQMNGHTSDGADFHCPHQKGTRIDH